MPEQKPIRQRISDWVKRKDKEVRSAPRSPTMYEQARQLAATVKKARTKPRRTEAR